MSDSSDSLSITEAVLTRLSKKKQSIKDHAHDPKSETSSLRSRTIKFQNESEPTPTEFHNEFARYNKFTLWFITILLVVLAPDFLIEMGRSAINVLKRTGTTCIIRELLNQNWTFAHAARISTPLYGQSCVYYNYTWSTFENMTFEEAEKFVKRNPLPNISTCTIPITFKYFSFDYPNFRGSCAGSLYKRAGVLTRTLSEVIGVLIIGFLGDLYGRKFGLFIGVPCLLIANLLRFISSNMYLYIFKMFLFGFGAEIISVINITLFMELCDPSLRGLLALTVVILEPLAKLTALGLCLQVTGNYLLRYAVTVPCVLLIFYIWYIPESPRWYISMGMKEKAWKFLKRLGSDISEFEFSRPTPQKKSILFKHNFAILFKIKRYRYGLFLITIVNFFRTTIFDYKWGFLNDRRMKPKNVHYLYSMAKLIGVLNTFPPYMMFGHNKAMLCLLCEAILSLLMALATTSPTAGYTCNMLALMSCYSLKSLSILYMCALFPTCVRLTGIAISVAIAKIGGLLVKITIQSLTYEGNHIWTKMIILLLAIISLVATYLLPQAHSKFLPEWKRGKILSRDQINK